MKHLKSYLIIFTGMAMTAVATGFFYVPNGIVTGGVSGIATIFYYSLQYLQINNICR